MRLSDKLSYFETDRGHGYGWVAEVDGHAEADLIDATYTRPFWRRFRVVPVQGKAIADEELRSAAFWRRKDILYRNRRLDLIVSLYGIQPDEQPGYVVHSGSYGAAEPFAPTALELTLLTARKAIRGALRRPTPPTTEGLPDLDGQVRRQILDSHYGHDFGWIVEKNGMAVAEMSDGRPFEMFWREWTLCPLVEAEPMRQAMLTDEFWDDPSLIYRNRKLDLLASGFLVRAGPQFGDKIVQRGGQYWPDPAWPTLTDRMSRVGRRQ